MGRGSVAGRANRNPARATSGGPGYSFEVDIVLERGSASVAGVEVKAAASVTDADFRGLRKLREAAGRRFASGAVVWGKMPCASTRFRTPRCAAR